MKLFIFTIAIMLYAFTAAGQLFKVPSIVGTIEINGKQAIIFSDKTWEYLDVLELKREIEESRQKTDSLKNLLYKSDYGNIEQPIENPNELNRRGLFPGISSSIATASLNGRSVIGSLPIPSYNSQNKGRVIVSITVDQNGQVTKANARGIGYSWTGRFGYAGFLRVMLFNSQLSCISFKSRRSSLRKPSISIRANDNMLLYINGFVSQNEAGNILKELFPLGVSSHGESYLTGKLERVQGTGKMY